MLGFAGLSNHACDLSRRPVPFASPDIVSSRTFLENRAKLHHPPPACHWPSIFVGPFATMNAVNGARAHAARLRAAGCRNTVAATGESPGRAMTLKTVDAFSR